MRSDHYRYIYVEDWLEKRFCSLFNNDESIIFSPNSAKLRPYYKISFLHNGTPIVQNTGYMGVKHYAIVTEKELDEMSLLPVLARVYYLLSL